MKHSTLMAIAEAIAKESKCEARQVGALIVRDGRPVVTGYNGTPPGMPNCNEVAKEDHRAWQLDNETHAELNAIIYAASKGIPTEGTVMVTTLEPCKQCALAIIGAGIKTVIYKETYWNSGVEMLRKGGVDVVRLK